MMSNADGIISDKCTFSRLLGELCLNLNISSSIEVGLLDSSFCAATWYVESLSILSGL
jgi:hypothetical protein